MIYLDHAEAKRGAYELAVPKRFDRSACGTIDLEIRADDNGFDRRRWSMLTR